MISVIFTGEGQMTKSSEYSEVCMKKRAEILNNVKRRSVKIDKRNKTTNNNKKETRHANKKHLVCAKEDLHL